MRFCMTGLATAIVFMMTQNAFAIGDCEAPEVAAAMEGELTKENLLAHRDDVKEYMTVSQAYLDCLAAHETTFTEETPAEERQALIDAHNAEVENQELVAGRFNELVQQYNANASN